MQGVGTTHTEGGLVWYGADKALLSLIQKSSGNTSWDPRSARTWHAEGRGGGQEAAERGGTWQGFSAAPWKRPPPCRSTVSAPLTSPSDSGLSFRSSPCCPPLHPALTSNDDWPRTSRHQAQCPHPRAAQDGGRTAKQAVFPDLACFCLKTSHDSSPRS